MRRPLERANQTKFFHHAQTWALRGLMLCVPMLLVLLALEFVSNPNPVPAVITIAGLVLLCFFFAYVFVAPDDFSISATDRTLGIASKIFAYTRHGLTPEDTLGACRIILPETLASAICVTDGTAVVASWGEGSDRCPTGTPVVLASTLRVLRGKRMEVFAREVATRGAASHAVETASQGDASRTGEPVFFPRLHAGIAAPLIVRDRCMGTLELYYPRYSDIDARQTALARGFAELISTQLASFELERQEEMSARMELRALQSQVDPHFLFNTIGTIVSLVRTEPEKARSLLIDFSNYYRQTLSNSEALTSLENELGQGMRYINLMQARYGGERLRLTVDLDPATLDSRVPPFILQPLLENCIKHAMREVEPLSISLVTRETDDGIEIVVEDDGVGMDEATRAGLFDVHHAPREASGEGGCASRAASGASVASSTLDGSAVPTLSDVPASAAPASQVERVSPSTPSASDVFVAPAAHATAPAPAATSTSFATTTADGSMRRGGGLALANVLMRIHFFFGEESGIRIESEPGAGTRVTVELVGEPHEPEDMRLPSVR